MRCAPYIIVLPLPSCWGGGGEGVHCEILPFRYSNTIDAIGVKLYKKNKEGKL